MNKGMCKQRLIPKMISAIRSVEKAFATQLAEVLSVKPSKRLVAVTIGCLYDCILSSIVVMFWYLNHHSKGTKCSIGDSSIDYYLYFPQEYILHAATACH
jgi:hypothetical protein